MQINFNIFVFGRREHHELISRVWLLRDVRSIYSIPFPAMTTNSSSVYFFSPSFSNVISYDITPESNGNVISDGITSELGFIIPWKSMKSSGSAWWTQKLMEDINLFALNPKDFAQNQTVNHLHEGSHTDTGNNDCYNLESPLPHNFFINTKLKLRIPLDMVSDVQANNSEHLYHNRILQDDPNDEFFQTHEDGSILLTPLFRRSLPQSHLNHQPQFISDQSVFTSHRYGLFLHHNVPIHSSNPSPYSHLPNLHDGKRMMSYYEPSEYTADYILYKHGDTSFSSSLYPLCIIPIDLCDEASINIAIWAYHILLYQYNNNFTFPQAHTKVVIMLFNRAGYDAHIINESQIREWFYNFPLQVEYLFYSPMFHLPHTTEIDDKIRTISTIHNPNAFPPSTASTLNSSSSSFTFDPHYLEQENANIDLATQLDQSFIAQIQNHFLEDVFLFSSTHRNRSPNLHLPRPFIQSSIRYPFRSMIGKPIKLGITENTKIVPFFVPNDMKHWCLFDKYDQDSIHKYDRLTTCGVSDSTANTSSVQALYKILPSHVTMFPDAVFPSAVLQVRRATELTSIFPETLENRDPQSYNTRQSFHHCTHLTLKFFPFNKMIPFEPVLPWTPKRILEEIGTDVFDLLTAPFSIINVPPTSSTSPTPLSQTTSQEQLYPTSPPHHQFSSSLPSLKSSFHLIQQKPQYVSKPTYRSTCTLKETTDNMIIDHFSTLSVEPIHQYSSSYLLHSSPDQSSQVLSSSSPSSPASPASPVEQINSTTTIYHSHVQPDRYYSTMYIGSEMQQGLSKEKKSLLMNSDLEDSPLLTNYPQQTLQILSQLFSSHIIPSSQPLPTPTVFTVLEETSTESSLSSTNESKTPIVSPLSTSSHHFHLQFDPLPDKTNYPYFLPYHSLLTYTVVDLTDLLAQVAAIEGFRKQCFQSTFLSSLAKLWQKQAQINFRYTIQSMVNAFDPQNLPKSSQPQQQLSSYTNNSLITDSKDKPELHTIITSTCDTVKFFQLAPFVSIQDPVFSSSIFDLYSSPTNVCQELTDRNVLPHFFIVIDNLDQDQDPGKLNTDSESSVTYCDSNRPTFLSKEAAIMQSYLCQFAPIAAGVRDHQYPLHYSFTPLAQLKSRMIECIQIAIAIRMDNYDFNSNSHYQGL